MSTQEERIKHCLKYMEWDVLSDAQHDLIVSFEEQFNKRGFLSDKQMEILEDIFAKAAEKA